MNGFYLDLLFVAIAAVLVYRLFMILGHRHGQERRRTWYFTLGKAKPASKRAASPQSDAPSYSGGLWDDLLAAEPTFEPERFLKGAKEAFTLIVEAFSQGDLDTLRPLLSPEVFLNFSSEIEQRRHDQILRPVKVNQIINCRPLKAGTEGSMAYVIVKFTSNQTTGPQLLAKPFEVSDIWTFRRQGGSNDPTWLLTDTQPAS